MDPEEWQMDLDLAFDCEAPGQCTCPCLPTAYSNSARFVLRPSSLRTQLLRIANIATKLLQPALCVVSVADGMKLFFYDFLGLASLKCVV